MGRVRFYTALILARLIYLAIRLLNKSSGTSFVGMMTLKFCPEFLKYCRKYVNKSISVTGTNGKTTTSGVLAHILEINGNRLIHNVKGANMLTGIANVFALNLPEKFDYAVLESDEAYLRRLYEYYKTDFLVVTNLFRDQLDRYGELMTTAGYIKQAIDKNKDLVLLLNADDPLVASFEGKNKIFYGIENVYYADESLKSKSSTEETFNCPCGKALKYEKKFFAQQGHYYCDCGYRRPKPKYSADVTLYKDYSILNIACPSETDKTYEIPLVGLYNAYNALAAIALCLELGIEDIEKHLSSFKVAFGRS